MLERCPMCGKSIGMLMESDPDRPGLIEILSGEANQGARRMALTVALCVLLVLAAVATEAVLR